MKHYLLIFKNVILDRIRRKTGKFYFIKALKKHPLRIIIGASGVAQDGWVPSDIDYLNLLNEDHWLSYFKENDGVDAFLAEHVWEHLSKSDAILATKNVFKYLKPGGYLRVAVPDGYFPDEKYIDYVKPGGSGFGSEDHKVLYTYKTFSNIFEKAGFKVALLEYFDENGVFHFNDWKSEDGMILRSKRYDERNQDGVIKYSSIILDARK